MAKHIHLVHQHLENISAKLLEDYQPIIREYIRGQHGIYALYKNNRLYYVGLASNMRSRLSAHLRDRHMGLWNTFSIYLLHDNDRMRELESLVLRIVKPKGNRQIGKLVGSQNLKAALKRDIKDYYTQQLQKILGQHKPRQPRRTRRKQRQSRANEAPGALAPYFRRSKSLRAERDGYIYRARVQKNGWVQYGKYLYKTPSGAAKAALGRGFNGWTFWHYQRSPGNWVPLKRLRK